MIELHAPARLLISFSLALAICASAVPLVRSLATRTGFYDYPGGFKGHEAPTPYLGGLAVVTGVTMASLAVLGNLTQFAPLLACAIGLAVVGTIDDRRSLGIAPRLAVEILAGVVLWQADLGWSVFESEGANLALTIGWVVGLVNAFNLMDNLDGAATTVAAASAAGVGAVAMGMGRPGVAVLSLAVAGACGGFLPWNMARPSRIFLGDGGSMPLGLLVAGLIMSLPEASMGWTAGLAYAPLAGLVIFDTALVVFSRIRRGVPVTNGARDHLTHRLLAFLGAPVFVAITLLLAQTTLDALALALAEANRMVIVNVTALCLIAGAVTILALEGLIALPGRASAPPSGRWRRANGVPDSGRVRVLQVIARLNVGGPTHVVSTLAGRRLDAARFECLVVHGSLAEGEESMVDLAQREEVRLEPLPVLAPPIRPGRDTRALAGLVSVMRRFRPDVIHTHTAKAGFLGRAAAQLAPGSPIIVHTFHGHVLNGHFGARKARLYRRLEIAMAQRTDCLIGVSKATVDELLALGVGSREQYRVIPVGLDLERFARIDVNARATARRELGVGGDDVVFTYAGRFAPVKRLSVLLQGFAGAAADLANVRLFLAGDGGQRSALEALASELGVRDRVRFLGYRRDVPRLLAASDGAVLSSASEGTPVSLIEAGAAGLPMVATDVGGVAEVVTPACGILVRPGDSGELATGLKRLATHPELRRTMGARARDRVLTRHPPERLVRETEDLYLELFEGRARDVQPSAVGPHPQPDHNLAGAPGPDG